jgi:FG-GAP repeat
VVVARRDHRLGGMSFTLRVRYYHFMFRILVASAGLLFFTCSDPNTTGAECVPKGFIQIGNACISTTPTYIKASNAGRADEFGKAVALSANGNTMAVGAPHESSSATGINGNQNDDSGARSGAVYVFTRSENKWVQQAYLKASNAAAEDEFGLNVFLTANGNTLAVLPARTSEGAVVYLFTRSGTSWIQQTILKPSSPIDIRNFRVSAALSGDGNTVAMTAPIGVYIFTRAGNTWIQQATVKTKRADASYGFGALALSGDGNVLAVGVSSDSSAAIGINGDQTDTSAISSGSVYVFARNENMWAEQAYVKTSNTEAGDEFGAGLALAADGNTLAVGALGESSAATGVNGNQSDNSVYRPGAVYVFVRTGGTWNQQAYVKASYVRGSEAFGTTVALSAKGNTLAVGATNEWSSSKGFNGKEWDSLGTASGAVYLFVRDAQGWAQKAYVKAPNTDVADYFGTAVSLNADGSTLAVGSVGEDSSATGINGTQNDEGALGSGAVYVYSP